KWTHGTLVTAMHGHSAFFGAYVMINLAIITYTMPHFTGRVNEARESTLGYWAFWLMIGGMFGMTLAYATAGIAQVYLERIMGVGYLDTQQKIQVHFLMLVGNGIIFTAGVAAFLWDFFRQTPLRAPALELATESSSTASRTA
ncbi:MAG: cbb3-type cytochrome c oxidase subunit I, partial [Gemmatimonadota bacterium]|nr:cbb3-type cytochrome c oxidase subunit I [Gemmatimonadota bacterium]